MVACMGKRFITLNAMLKNKTAWSLQHKMLDFEHGRYGINPDKLRKDKK
jgi:hypothetical protein